MAWEIPKYLYKYFQGWHKYNFLRKNSKAWIDMINHIEQNKTKSFVQNDNGLFYLIWRYEHEGSNSYNSSCRKGVETSL